MKTVIINMSGVYRAERFSPDDASIINLQDLDGTSCYCDPEAQDHIREAVRKYPAQGLHWIDSGDYHYLTYFWLEKIEEPFELLLIDNHTDDQEPAFGGDILSCGGWVHAARQKLGYLRKDWFTRDQLPEDLKTPGLPLYISIDKDALSREFARTDWNQGNLALGNLMDSLLKIERRIIGIDVCGELSTAKGATDEDLSINLETNSELQDFFINLQTE